MSLSMPDVLDETELDESLQNDTPWTVVVSNDPINLVNVVASVFQKVLKITQELAMEYTLKVHNEGRCAVYWGSQEECQNIAQELMYYQLWTHVEKSGE